MNELQNQQKFVASAFIYWDNRGFIDLLDPLMFGDYAPIISTIKQYSNGADIVYHCWEHASFIDMTDIDSDIAFHYRHANFWEEFMRLYEMFLDNKFKTSKNKLNRDAVKKVNILYDKLQKRLEWNIENNIFEESERYIKMAQEKNGIRTGLSFLDESIGWLRSGTVTRVSGYSNIGKSRFMYRVMVNILKQGKSVHLFSLEVPKGVVLINLVWAYYDISTSSVEYWHKSKELKEFYAQFKEQLLIEDDKTSLDQIEASVVVNNKDCIFIDYVQNITANGKDEYERMTRIAQELQKMAISTWKPFFDLSQVSNEWTRYKVGDMIPSKGTGAFVHACDIGLVLSKWEESEITKNRNIINLTLAKNKFWIKDIEFRMEVDMASCRFNLLSDNKK